MAVNFRVEMRPGVRCDERSMRQLILEFRKRYNESGVATTYKDHQFFESDSSKARKKKKNSVNKIELETIEMKMSRGEKVKCSSKMIKKIRAKQAKIAKAAKRGVSRGDQRIY